MSEVIEAAVEAMQAKFPDGIDGAGKCVLRGEGAVMVDAEGVRADDEDAEADVTLAAEVEVFRAILEGRLSPTVAFMSGRLSVRGDMGLAMRLSSMMG